MDRHGKEIYLGEVLKQSEMSLRAANTISQALNAARENKYNHEARASCQAEVFRSIHSFLTHLSNVSKLLWPPVVGKKCSCNKNLEGIDLCSSCFGKLRSSTLLEVLGIGADEHPLKDRDLRNHLEHFDERLDYWFQNSKGRNIVQDCIGPKGMLVSGIDKSDHMREFDPATGDFGFRGESYSLMKLADGAQDIIIRSNEALARICKERYT